MKEYLIFAKAINYIPYISIVYSVSKSTYCNGACLDHSSFISRMHKAFHPGFPRCISKSTILKCSIIISHNMSRMFGHHFPQLGPFPETRSSFAICIAIILRAWCFAAALCCEGNPEHSPGVRILVGDAKYGLQSPTWPLLLGGSAMNQHQNWNVGACVWNRERKENPPPAGRAELWLRTLHQPSWAPLLHPSCNVWMRR